MVTWAPESPPQDPSLVSSSWPPTHRFGGGDLAMSYSSWVGKRKPPALIHGVAGGFALWLVTMAKSDPWWWGMGESRVQDCSPSRDPSNPEPLLLPKSLLVLLLLL